ncbi:MAG: hypothetical protein HY532_07500 [Chloroflexi bacterium]|nr:hypothetical protein [Chloroflexota bacterium]
MTTRTLIDELQSAAQQAQAKIASVQDAAALEAWRVEFLGRRGRLSQLMQRLGSLSPEERRVAGAEANRVTNWMKVEYSNTVPMGPSKDSSEDAS